MHGKLVCADSATWCVQDLEKLSSLEDYVSRMKEDQKQIYYLSGVVRHSATLLWRMCGFCRPCSLQAVLQGVVP